MTLHILISKKVMKRKEMAILYHPDDFWLR